MYFFFLLPHQWSEWHSGEVQVITWDIQPQSKIAGHIVFREPIWSAGSEARSPHFCQLYDVYLHICSMCGFIPPLNHALPLWPPTHVPLYILIFYRTQSQTTHYYFPLNTTQEADTVFLVRVWRQSKLAEVSTVFFKPNKVQWAVVLTAVLVFDSFVCSWAWHLGLLMLLPQCISPWPQYCLQLNHFADSAGSVRETCCLIHWLLSHWTWTKPFPLFPHSVWHWTLQPNTNKARSVFSSSVCGKWRATSSLSPFLHALIYSDRLREREMERERRRRVEVEKGAGDQWAVRRRDLTVT